MSSQRTPFGLVCTLTSRSRCTQFRNDSDFADNIVANTGRYVKLFSEAIDESLPSTSTDINQVGCVVYSSVNINSMIVLILICVILRFFFFMISCI